MIKKIIKKIINSAGYATYPIESNANPAFQLLLGLKHFKVDMILDVGANIGQFASELRSIGFQGQIVSFEPLSEAHHVLSKSVSEDPLWVAHPRCAIGDHDGEIKINISGNSYSSSILPMLESHSAAAPNSAYVSSENAPIFKLDTVAPNYLQQANNPFLKIDTQGFEWQVLDGSISTLPQICGILCELSLVELYKGQHLWQEIIQRLESLGFTLWMIQRGFSDPRNGRALQIDVVFFRL